MNNVKITLLFNIKFNQINQIFSHDQEFHLLATKTFLHLNIL